MKRREREGEEWNVLGVARVRVVDGDAIPDLNAELVLSLDETLVEGISLANVHLADVGAGEALLEVDEGVVIVGVDGNLLDVSLRGSDEGGKGRRRKGRTFPCGR